MTSWHVSRFMAVAVIAAVILMFANCSRILFAALNAPAYAGFYERRADIRYGTAERQTLDVYVPDSASRRPVVMFWYGGIWTNGSKERYRFVGAALANSGYIAVLPDYRLYPRARFPMFIEDGALAVKWARDHVSELGGDPEAIFLMGHSAGAHLAASLALDSRYLRKVGGNTDWIRGWIGLSGPYALDTGIVGRPILQDIFRAPYVPADWQLVALVHERAPPALLLHGDRDIFPADVLELDRSLRAAGNYAECHFYDNADHMDTVAAFSLPLRIEAPALTDVRRFVDRFAARTASSYELAAGVPCPPLPAKVR
jgi:acetyl esterase/lipase